MCDIGDKGWLDEIFCEVFSNFYASGIQVGVRSKLLPQRPPAPVPLSR